MFGLGVLDDTTGYDPLPLEDSYDAIAASKGFLAGSVLASMRFQMVEDFVELAAVPITEELNNLLPVLGLVGTHVLEPFLQSLRHIPDPVIDAPPLLPLLDPPLLFQAAAQIVGGPGILVRGVCRAGQHECGQVWILTRSREKIAELFAIVILAVSEAKNGKVILPGQAILVPRSVIFILKHR
jgi:hypothetical protein